MTTRLDSELKREIMISGTPYTLTITPDKFVLVLKGRRKGLEIRWTDLVSGEAALATALNASLKANIAAPAKRSLARRRQRHVRDECVAARTPAGTTRQDEDPAMRRGMTATPTLCGPFHSPKDTMKGCS